MISEIQKNRAERLDQAADYIGEALNIVQDILWEENTPKETRETLNDLYDRIYDTMNRVRSAEYEERSEYA